jgi:capsular polysaccharide biosynthesis protein
LADHDEAGSPGPLQTIDGMAQAIASGHPILRHPLAPAETEARPRLPLIAGTERFAGHWLPDYHALHSSAADFSLDCYSVLGARISGSGQVWIDGRLVTTPEIMPEYVPPLLGIAAGGNEALWQPAGLPVRQIDDPCLVAIGHGTQVYGHFLIEMLFRILIARRALAHTKLKYRLLLDEAAPRRLLRILEENLGIGGADIAFFQPAEEQVLLRHALLSTNILRVTRFHPEANALLAELLDGIDLARLPETPPRPFIARRHFRNPAAPYRACLNEEALINIAARRHGFMPVAVETLSWPRQIGLFRNAEIAVGLAGSGLHNALFAQAGSCLASLGVMNFVQSAIGGLRGQRNAFLDNVPLSGDFSLDEALFAAFLDAVVEGAEGGKAVSG